jgi:hypothetical protein
MTFSNFFILRLAMTGSDFAILNRFYYLGMYKKHHLLII